MLGDFLCIKSLLLRLNKNGLFIVKLDLIFKLLNRFGFWLNFDMLLWKELTVEDFINVNIFDLVRSSVFENFGDFALFFEEVFDLIFE